MLTPDFEVGINAESPSHPPMLSWEPAGRWVAGRGAGGRGTGLSLVTLGIAIALTKRRSSDAD